jgi:RNA polymerase sigma factor (sigma-70 family)
VEERLVIPAPEEIDWERVRAAAYKITGQVTAVKEVEQTVRKQLQGKFGTEWQGGRDCQEIALGITQTVAAEWLIAHLDWRELEAYMYALTHRIGSTDEITQAVRDKLLRMSADGWHGVADRKKYLYGIVYNTAVDWLKREEAQQYGVARRMRQSVPHDANGHDVAGSACAQSDVVVLLKRLGPRVRQAFVFRKLWGYTVKEIAQRMSIREETVKAYLSKAAEEFSDLEGSRENRRPGARITRWFTRKEDT